MANVTKLNIGGTDYDIVDASVPSWAKASTKPSYTASEISGLANVATSGSYNDLADKPDYVSSVTYDSSTRKIRVSMSGGRASTPVTLASVATSGSYNDLTDKPTIPAAVTVDSTITQNGTNPVQGGAIYNALEGKQDRQVEIINLYYNGYEPTWTNSSGDSMTAVQVNTLLRNSSKNVIIKATFDDIGMADGTRLYYRTSPIDDDYIMFYALEHERVYWIGIDANLSDYSYMYLEGIDVVDISSYVKKSFKINNKPLSGNNMTLTSSDVGAVPTTRTVNGKALSSNITLSASDIGAIPTVISTTYNDLVTVRTNSQLIEGAWYRITDYTCTTSQTDTQSAEHQFDILVQAVSLNKLSEEAKAIRHEGDTYFAQSNLEAWKIWYCLDNDTTRFAWADETNGKGVIYRMIDEWGNDCPYDFKNIQFKRYQLKNRNYLYASKALWDNDGNTYDNEVIANFHNTFTILYNNLNTSINNINIPFYYTRGVHDEYYIVDESEIYGYDEIYETYRDNSGNTIALSENGTRKFVALYNLLHDYYDIILEVNDTEGEWMYTFSRKNGINTPSIDNSLNGKIYNNKFTNSKRLFDNIFISYNIDLTIQDNVFGPSFQNNTFGNHCTSNTFEGYCYNNFFGNGCYNNTFGNEYSYNTFGESCYSNTFGNECNNNFFGNECLHNIFGNYYQVNSTGNYFQYNTFGNGCNGNSFGNEFCLHFFGNECYSNTFGNYCHSNTVGNAVNNVTFSKDYTRYVIVENGNQYITLTSTATTNYDNPLRNITIAQGVNNTTTTKTISHNTLNDTFRTTYTVDTSGNIYAITPTKYGEWDNKQSTLISGTNIKTINNQSLVGSGNLTLRDIGADAFIVNITSSNGIYISDKTYSQITTAYNSKRNVFAVHYGAVYQLIQINNYGIRFVNFSQMDVEDRMDVIYISASDSISYDEIYYQRGLISGTNIKTINNQSLLGSGNIEIESGGNVTVENVTDTGDVIKSLEPNIFYKFGTVDSLTIPLISGTDLAVYSGKFTIDSLSTALSFFVVPATVITAYSCPTITAGNTYEFNILDNVLMMLEI